MQKIHCDTNKHNRVFNSRELILQVEIHEKLTHLTEIKVSEWFSAWGNIDYDYHSAGSIEDKGLSKENMSNFIFWAPSLCLLKNVNPHV